jgi:mannose-1-phosphate guanylyltransferase
MCSLQLVLLKRQLLLTGFCSDRDGVVTPADQTVAETVAFTQAMQQTVREAESGNVVILGITPNRPETGYGYIQSKS